jgi:hypothetical protein
VIAAAILLAAAPAQGVPDGYRAPPELRLLPSPRCLRFEAPARQQPPRDEADYLAGLDAAIDYCSPPRDQAIRETATALARIRPGASPEALSAEARRMLDEWRANFRRELARNNSFQWNAPAVASLVKGAMEEPVPRASPGFTPEQTRSLLNAFERQKRIAGLSNEQALIVYDQCLSREAASLSRTDLAEDAIFDQALRRCIVLRADLLSGSPPERFIQFKKLDESKAAAFPALTRQVRERRRAFEAQAGSPR